MHDDASGPHGNGISPPGPSATALVIDLNFLPERYRRRAPTLRTLRPALFLLGFTLLLIPLLRSWSESRGQLQLVETALAQVQTELQEYQPLAEERAQLEARIESAQAAASDIQAAYDTVNIQSVTWNRLVARSLAILPNGVTVTQVSQVGDEVVFEGVATAYPLPSRFADELRSLGDFAGVSIQSITRVERVETESATADIEAEAADLRPEQDEPQVPEYRFEISTRIPVRPEPAASPTTGPGEGS